MDGQRRAKGRSMANGDTGAASDFPEREAKGSDGTKRWLNYTHMSMLEQMPGGKLMAAWQAAPVMEGTPEQRIWYARSRDRVGRAWEKPQQIPEHHFRAAVWSPVLHFDKTSACLWLFFAESSPKCLRQEIVRKPKNKHS
eukprot:CAMPEP_0197852460 /NCGR_PEP_ID=MMETSP1438-20131217/20649_1 /TAXON_ID=1461541 /ORGANISM="Pterosperma sp., Strain CCMP1384" /LENGTH=139 /DNA_ID=CAMNT_0043466527 /DNA_START=101 /DNA_END=518 /DNA_ORIENTATION=+